MKTLYLTDLDGTFLDTNAQITRFSADTINFLSSKGVLFTVATARTFATVIPMFKDVSLTCPVVLMNGVCIYDPVAKKNLNVHTLDIETAKKAEEIFRKYNKNPMFYYEYDSKIRVEYKELVNKEQESYVSNRDNFFNKGFVRVEKYTYDSDCNFIYIVTLDKKAEIEGIYKEVSALPDIDCTFYNDNYTDCYFFEGMKKGISKATGALEVKKMLGADKIVAFGDNKNDIPLFEIADEAYAVANACDELKQKATGIIGSNSEDAVAKFLLERYESGLINK